MEVLHQISSRQQGAKMSLKNALRQRRGEIIRIADQYGVHNIRIFGSVGNETERPDSDVDFLVDLEKGRSLLDLGGMVFDLQQLLGRNVDIVTEKGLHWYIKETILNEAEPL
ncbi:MAG: nucleotidyltransferase family protein [Desulfoprunum sp.]|nr:nucleotidyltransferase family protein [Desulfoprunum sp.]